MNKNLKNIIILLVLILLAFVGYYIYTQNGVNELSFDANGSVDQNVIASTDIFIKRRAMLESLKIDTSLLEDPVFLSLRDYTGGVPTLLTGRENPFDEREPAVEVDELGLEN